MIFYYIIKNNYHIDDNLVIAIISKKIDLFINLLVILLFYSLCHSKYIINFLFYIL